MNDIDRASQAKPSEAATTSASGTAAAPAASNASSNTNASPNKDGALLYDRRFSVQVFDANKQGLDLSALRCVFAVRQFERETPNYMDLHITTLSAATASRMVREFTRVQVSAGYEGQYGIIFDGFIIQARRGRDSPTDTYCHIVATDFDTGHNFATVNTTLAAGSTPEDVHKVVLSAFNQYGVEKGYTDPAMTGPGLPRGRVLFGMARDVMRDVAKTTGTVWSVQNGRMQVVSRDGYLPNEAVVINRDTGMIGLPAVAPDGIHVKCLLNPLLRIGSLIKLNNDSIQQPHTPAGPAGNVVGPDGKVVEGTTLQLYPRIEGDGTYKVLAVDHYGDTRGNPWYSDIEAIAVSQGGTAASARRGRGTWVDPANQQPQPAPLNSSSTSTTGTSDNRRDRDAYTSPSPAPLPADATTPSTPSAAHIPTTLGRTGY